MQIIRNQLNKLNEIKLLRSTKKPSFNKLGFLVDHSHNALILYAILVWIIK